MSLVATLLQYFAAVKELLIYASAPPLIRALPRFTADLCDANDPDEDAKKLIWSLHYAAV